MKIRLFFILLLAFNISWSEDVSVDAAMSGFQFLEDPSNPEMIGRGYAGAALGGMGGYFYNPSKYSFIEKPTFHLEFSRYKNWDIKKVNFEALVPVKKTYVLYGMKVFTSDNIQYVDDLGGLPSGFGSERGVLITAGTGLEINQFLNIGIAAAWSMHDILDNYAQALLFSAGLIASPIPGKLNISISSNNFGFTTGMSDTTEKFGEGERLPTNSRLAIGWQDTLKIIDYKILFDIVYRGVRDTSKKFIHRISDRFSFPLGLEVLPVAPLVLRIGKRINFPTEILNMGIGLKTTALDFDFGLVINKLIDDTEPDWAASFTYRLIKREKEFKKELSKRENTKQLNNLTVKDSIINEKNIEDQDSLKGVKLDNAKENSVIEKIDISETSNIKKNGNSDSLSNVKDAIIVEIDSLKNSSVNIEIDSVKEVPEATAYDKTSIKNESVSSEIETSDNIKIEETSSESIEVNKE